MDQGSNYFTFPRVHSYQKLIGSSFRPLCHLCFSLGPRAPRQIDVEGRWLRLTMVVGEVAVPEELTLEEMVAQELLY